MAYHELLLVSKNMLEEIRFDFADLGFVLFAPNKLHPTHLKNGYVQAISSHVQSTIISHLSCVLSLHTIGYLVPRQNDTTYFCTKIGTFNCSPPIGT